MANEGNATLTREFVPQEYHGEEYVKPWLDKPWDKATGAEVFKKLVNAESLLGKRTAVPGKDAKPEEYDKFFAQFRPEKPEDYEIPVAEGVKANEAVLKTVRDALYAGDITKRGAQKFLAKMNEAALAEKKNFETALAKSNQEFDTAAKAALGEKSSEVMAVVRKTMEENLPAAYLGQLDKLGDRELFIMTAAIHGILKKYASEDALKLNDNNSDKDAGSLQVLLEEGRKLQASKEYLDPFNSKHEETKKQVEELYKKIAKLKAGT